MKILITGFEPFNREKINPSQEAVNLLTENINNCTIIKKIIPTVFNKSFEVLKKEIDTHNPDVVVCVGQAGGRSKVTIERVAINIDDAPIADNEGYIPTDEKIQSSGENAYFSTLPIKAIVQNIKEKNIPADVSNSAGTFVCNHIMYQTLHYSKISNKNFKAGFIHIPFLPEQTINNNQPSMSLENTISALTSSLETIIEFQNREDIKTIGGSDV